ncbi:MAG: hypothetical protein CBB95_09735 [Alteromonas sp. TMED35]|jgi:type IV secretory pathway VirB2 component (pilin)|uniref:hypothetical protein n=1 Tax=uncultured Alteromonas sp. TaxID=179113 RepID=UPI000B6C2ECE|nr:MAG: hypothetical protein CBB95_09735 [Alteromonas sp. TMED35]|tara:strand:+ start:2535 stop:2945 length:411 start_codon:yes stop_codon:yes gene_type:complete
MKATNFFSSKTGKLAALVGLFAVSGAAMATGTTTGIDNILSDVIAFFEGPFGKLIIVLAFGYGLVKILATDWIQVGSAFLAGLTLANLSDIVDSTGVGAAVTAAKEEMMPVVTTAAIKAQDIACACVDCACKACGC